LTRPTTARSLDHLTKAGGGDRTIARAAKVPRLIHVSTEAVLADGKPIIAADETRPRTTRPAAPYPLSKGLAEERVLAANRDGLATIIVRPRFIWGAGDTNLIPKIVETVKRGRFGWIGGGHYPTSTCHVDNVVEGILLAAERGAPGEIYFLTDGEPADFRDFLTRSWRPTASIPVLAASRAGSPAPPPR
jgi:nucleoside-diphosphate-sugar epimerase